MSNEVLFVCTGNYYRSRFAEMLFNALALRDGLDWKANSRGLAAEAGKNVGPVSPYVLRRLEQQGYLTDEAPRDPRQLEEADLARADLIIALDAAEHLSLIEARFARWADQVQYWHVPDLNLLAADGAFSRIEHSVAILVKQLSAQQTV
jgi:protein-tyrosine phosphatase